MITLKIDYKRDSSHAYIDLFVFDEIRLNSTTPFIYCNVYELNDDDARYFLLKYPNNVSILK